jgi:hypothetical protein
MKGFTGNIARFRLNICTLNEFQWESFLREALSPMRVMHLKSEIAQRVLSDLCRKPSVG